MTQTKFKLNRKALFGLMVLAAIGGAPVHAATIKVIPTVADGVIAMMVHARCARL